VSTKQDNQDDLLTNKINHDTTNTPDLVSSPLSISEVLEGASTRPLFPIERTVEYLGVVNYATSERVLHNIKSLIKKSPTDQLYLIITSAGGPSGTAMSFYDTVRYVLRPNLTTIGSGDVDSSAMLLFLTGERRYVTAHTTALLHRAGRVFDNNKRVTSSELASMMREDLLKDEQYAAIVSERTLGRLSPNQVLELMDANTTLTPKDFVQYGLADSILE
jgi:ATP-dependent protease ClpP protease subunit